MEGRCSGKKIKIILVYFNSTKLKTRKKFMNDPRLKKGIEKKMEF